jgi:hypothetical protein
MAYTERRETHRRRPTASGLLLPPIALFLAVILTAALYVAYVLWPRWPGPIVAPNAPALPITIAGVTFNVPPAAIRVRMQRHAGTQERIDLAFLWPSLTPPELADKYVVPASGEAITPRPSDRLFVTIAAADGTLPPIERFKNIYPRFTEGQPAPGPGGLKVLAFRAGTPYQGEEMIYDPLAPEMFLTRCTRYDTGPIRGTCLIERRIGNADVMVRFPRDWLNDWRRVSQGIDRLIASFKPIGA